MCVAWSHFTRRVEWRLTVGLSRKGFDSCSTGWGLICSSPALYKMTWSVRWKSKGSQGDVRAFPARPDSATPGKSLRLQTSFNKCPVSTSSAERCPGPWAPWGVEGCTHEFFPPPTGTHEFFPVSFCSPGAVYLLLWGILGLCITTFTSYLAFLNPVLRFRMASRACLSLPSPMPWHMTSGICS